MNRIIKDLVRSIIRLINRVIPKDAKRIYLTSSFIYRDNIHAILDELLKNTDSYKITCVGNNFNQYSEHEVEHVKNRTFKAFWRYFRAKYIFYDVTLYLDPAPVKNQTIVNVWHGAGFKKVGYFLKYNQRRGAKETCSYFLTASNVFVPIFAHSFGIPESRVLTTGLTRNDYLHVNDNKVFEKLSIDVNNRKVIIWMPTYRQAEVKLVNYNSDGGDYPYGIPLINEKNLIDLNNLLSKNDLHLIIKYHGMQIRNNPSDLVQSNISILTSENIQDANLALYEVLSQCDALITDYSSVYVDYLTLDRPIIFTVDDLEVYKKNRGFACGNIEHYMPGEFVDSMNELMRELEKFSNGIDNYKEKRNNVNRILNNYSDNKNTKRLLRMLEIID